MSQPQQHQRLKFQQKRIKDQAETIKQQQEQIAEWIRQQQLPQHNQE